MRKYTHQDLRISCMLSTWKEITMLVKTAELTYFTILMIFLSRHLSLVLLGNTNHDCMKILNENKLERDCEELLCLLPATQM